jgi:glycerol uptake facilitator-like aquaporin
MEQTFRACVGELLGTFVVVFFGAGTVCAAYLGTFPALNVTAIALAEGIALGVMLTATARYSIACYNPAVSVALWVFKELDNKRAALLIGVQLLGAALAGLAIRLLFTEDILIRARLGAPHLKAFLEGNHVTVTGLLCGVGVELVFACVLTLAIFATLYDSPRPRLGGFGVGLAQAAIILVGFRLTGGAANPARWFGPVAWESTLPRTLSDPWADHAVYWAGPLLGALLGAWVYTTVFLPHTPGGARKR